MTFEIWIYYVLAVLVLTASPGPSSLLCMTKGVTAGWKIGAYTALGSLTAITSILTLSFTGLGVIIASSEVVFNLIKWVGAGYLIFLGIKSFTSKSTHFESPSPAVTGPSHFASHYMSGFIVGASNPKAIIFFTALFPQFINPSEALFFQYLVFAITFAVLELTWLLFYAYLGSKSSNWVFASGRAEMFNKLTGGVFIGAGTLLSTVNRS
ncbi:LysE family translocator [Photobacterium rosenbergii]|uniref:LysE family translocator n=1 Tax=Photobacterium rosenbergii TaxID=294936 RepID=A0A2T3NFQ2_9GAMM|nr:LysE family translocator [Photobacterium rosenbergii]PSW13408.1 LysE family translocator [Photobacterium rosenbergii]